MSEIVAQQHYVTFFSPGTFVSERTTRPIDGWDVDAAADAAHSVLERHNAKPYAFQFSTRGRGPDEFDSHEIAKSPLYWLGGKIETLAEVEARNDPGEHILRSNMRNNDYDRVITNTNSWKHTAPFGKDDVLLEWKP